MSHVQELVEELGLEEPRVLLSGVVEAQGHMGIEACEKTKVSKASPNE